MLICYGSSDVFGSVIGLPVEPLESKVASGEGKDLIHLVSGSKNGPVRSPPAVPSAKAAGDRPIFRDEGSKDGHSATKVGQRIFQAFLPFAKRFQVVSRLVFIT